MGLKLQALKTLKALKALILGGAVVLASGSAWAAIPSQQTLFAQTLTQKKNRYLSEGVFTGGHAGLGSSVLGVRRTYSAKARVERVIVDIGNSEGKPAPQKMGYFQASVDATAKRVVLDLAQLRMTSVSEPKLKELFKKSPFVASAEFTLDPEDKAGSLVLRLKQPVRLEVFQLVDKNKPARIVMDLIPAVKR